MTFKKLLKAEWQRNFDEKQCEAQDTLCKGRELIKKREDDCRRVEEEARLEKRRFACR